MAKSKTSYICQSCGTTHNKWGGKCDGCGEWNTLSEEITENAVPKGLSGGTRGRSLSFSSLKSKDGEKKPRLVTTIGEFDRVCGGGLVPGSALLIGGDPGIGKSTLLLQVVCALAAKKDKEINCAYVSGEEAIDQVRLRAERLELEEAPVRLAAATNVRDILAAMENKADPIDLIVIDSIQTMYVDNVESAPGTVTQVRTSSHEIIRSAKKHGICVLFVGHVTKDGQIAGPRVLEHMVDTVLYFEGDRSHQFRILRSVKNRFGATDEIGVFEMAGHGLVEVANPSEIFLAQRQQDVAGSAVFAGLEGSRPVLVEIQALVAPSGLATPRRAVIGWDNNRLAMVLAVLESRCGLQFSGRDIFLNVAGGIRINEPAADMAVAAALISSMTNVATPHGAVFFGEVGLGGEIRPVAQPDLRLKEASKLGFTQAFLPTQKKKKGRAKSAAPQTDIKCGTIENVMDLVTMLSHETNLAQYG